MKPVSIRDGWILRKELSTIMDTVMPGNGPREAVTLPHDALISMRRSADSAGGPGMGYFTGENLEYSRQFTVPSSEKDRVHYLYFDGVYSNAVFTLNGIFIGRFPYGYAPCSMRIDEYLRYDEPNTLRVMIRGSALPSGRWYPGLGIYRDAWMMTGDYLHVADHGLHITTLDCAEDFAVLEVKADIQNEGAQPREGYACLRILDSEGREAARRKARFYLGANSRIVVRQRVHLSDPALWDTDHPNLYTCECVLHDKGSDADADCAEAVFGIRKLQLDTVHGLRINGKSVKLKGGCVHHDNGVLGAASYFDAELRKIQKHKDAGYNALRTAHNPPSAAFLEACDRVGMLVMHEFTDVWAEAKAIYDYGCDMPVTWESDVEAVVRRDYNHPSVIFWSIGNEIPETGNRVSNKWGRLLSEKFRSLDPSRFITNGINPFVSCIEQLDRLMKGMDQQPSKESAGGVNDAMANIAGLMDFFASSPAVDDMIEEACDMLDVIGYNYSAERYEREHKTHPDRIFLGSETNPPKLDGNWDIVKRNGYVLGDFCWTSWDYLGEVGVGRLKPVDDPDLGFMAAYPWLSAYCGDFDMTGFRRPVSYWREIVWGGRRGVPYISVHRPERYGTQFSPNAYAWTDSLNSWTWPGREGMVTAIEVFSDAEEVELFVNGA